MLITKIKMHDQGKELAIPAEQRWATCKSQQRGSPLVQSNSAPKLAERTPEEKTVGDLSPQ